MNSDITSMLRLNQWAGRVVLVFYGLGTSVVALLNIDGYIVPGLDVAAIVLLWASLAILGLSNSEPLGLSRTTAVLTMVGTITAITCWNIADPLHPGYTTWPLGATTFLLLVLALRGRRKHAWVGFGIVTLIAFVIGALGQQDIMRIANDVVRQSATLVVGTLFALVLRRASQTITAIQNNQLTRATIAAATAAATRERAAQIARLERDARPALERILSGIPLTEAERQHFVLLESTLRDGIRATGFSSERVSEATRSARERGLRVVLLDDRSSELVDGERDRVERALLEQLTTTLGEGSITARLSPEDHDEIATIVVEEGGEYRRVVISENAVEVTHL